jgi:crotonobetainyl-CoA:carnitine CoA-transferase CaiB-like acyl-CoA transferase
MTTTPARLENRTLVDGLVAGWVAERDAPDALAALEAAEVPSSMVASVRDLFEDAHVQARENIVSAVLPLLGKISMPGVIPKLTRTPGRIESAGPSRPGEHNEQIYCGRLGLSREELTRLGERGVI